ncbi:MAG: zinc-dependent metalloprotease [Bacteroidetes bacterium]|nr:zinc-dependent metalloprotease [Bacteroidota bacterium]
MKVSTPIRSVLTVALFVLVGANVLAQQPQSFEASLFRRTVAPALNAGAPFPADAGFFTIDPYVFGQAAQYAPPVSRIENFPLGSGTVTLSVSQFEATTRDAKIVGRTATGDIPLALPAHVLLRGEVDGRSGSHVYLAVFDKMVLGYVELVNADGSSTRYLVQPVSQSGEAATTMICYAQNAIDRTHDASAKWICGTEELPGNFKALDRIAADIAAPADPLHNASVQAKNVRVAKVDIECDYRYYQDFKNDTSKALAYALATLAASSDIYVRDLNAALVSQYLKLWITNDPYRNESDTTINATLDSWTNSNDLPSDNRAGAILLSGWKGIGGLAWLGTICSVNSGLDHGYCVCGTNDNVTYPRDGFVWDVDVVSHEFGHVVGSPHTHSCFWNPAIDSCYPAEGNCFSGTVPTTGTIMSYCHLTSGGVILKFHTRNIPKMLQWLQAATCLVNEQLPQANAGPDAYVCGTDSATVSGSGQFGTPPYVYSWRNMRTNFIVGSDPSFKIKPNATTTYVLTLTDANNLRTYDTMVVNIDQLKAVTGGSLTVCGAGQINLHGTTIGGFGATKKGYTYKWVEKTSGTIMGVDSVITVPVSATTTYTFTAMDSVGCSSSADLIVTVAPKPVCTVNYSGPLTVCENDSVQIDAGSGFKTYLWLKNGSSVGVTTQKYWVKAAGSYSCLVTNTGQGCEDTSNAIAFTKLTAPTRPTITQTGNTLNCPTSVEYASYQWYKSGSLISGATNPTFTPTSNGQYFVIVTGTNGCESRSNTLSVTSGVITKELDEHISIYPNPASNELVLEWNDVPASTLMVSVTDALGKTVLAGKRVSIGSSSIYTLDLRSLSSGTYVLHYDFGFGEGTRKFVKQ